MCLKNSLVVSPRQHFIFLFSEHIIYLPQYHDPKNANRNWFPHFSDWKGNQMFVLLFRNGAVANTKIMHF